MSRVPSRIRVLLAVAAAAIAAAGCGGASSSEPETTTTGARGEKVPKTVYGSFPTPEDSASKTETQPATPGAPSRAPRSVYGSLPVPPLETRPGAGGGGTGGPAEPPASVTFVLRGPGI